MRPFDAPSSLTPDQRRAAVANILAAGILRLQTRAALSVAMGDRGCLSLFGDSPDQHRLFAEHMSAEYRVKTEGRGRTVDEWKMRPERGDNHWFDGLVGCAVAASMQGVVLQGTDGMAQAKRERVSFAELQRSRRR